MTESPVAANAISVAAAVVAIILKICICIKRRTALKAFVGEQQCCAFLPSGFGKSLVGHYGAWQRATS